MLIKLGPIRMRSKRLPLIITLFCVAALAAIVVLPALKRAKAYSGPGIFGNLRSIHMAKDAWLAAGNTNEWPTAADLFGASDGRALNQIMRPKYGELYFINRTGAPPFAYVPKGAGQYRDGEIRILASNGIVVIQQ